jgi:hypothetical protein
MLMSGPHPKPPFGALRSTRGSHPTLKSRAIGSRYLPASGFKFLALAGIAFLFLSSCGYQFSGQGDGPEPGLATIAIPVFKNNTSEPNAGAIFAAALRQQFMRKGNIKVVPKDEAQAYFEGTIKSIFVIPVGHSPVEVVSERATVEDRIYMTISIRCVDKKTKKVIWQNPAFSYWKVYDVDNAAQNLPPIAGFENRQLAIQYIADQTARCVHDRFLSSF